MGLGSSSSSNSSSGGGGGGGRHCFILKQCEILYSVRPEVSRWGGIKDTFPCASVTSLESLHVRRV